MDMSIPKGGEATEGFILNHYRVRKVGKKYLLTTDHGSWLFLDKDCYENFRKGKISDDLHPLFKERGFILSEDNINKQVEDYCKRFSPIFQGTSLHIVIPTLRCNQGCIYSNADSKPADADGFDMSIETAKKAVEIIFQSPSPRITIEFQGGEPLLRLDMVERIVAYAKEKNLKCKRDLKFRLVTNLTLMTEDALRFFKTEKIEVCALLDSSVAMHNQKQNDYKKTVAWIKKIKESCPLHAIILVTKDSLHCYKEIIDEHVRLGFDTIWIKPKNRFGRTIESQDVTAEEFLDFWKKSLGYLLELNKKMLTVESFSMVLLKKIISEGTPFVDLQSPCGAAISQLAYDYDGAVYTCAEGRQYDLFKLGTVDSSYVELLGSEDAVGVVMASITDSFVTCNVCAYKPYCGVCPVCSYAETGNAMTKFPNRRCQILKGMFDFIFEKLASDNEYRKMFMRWLGKSSNIWPLQ